MSALRRRPDDAGFTLVELLIVIAVQGIIVTAIAAAFMVFVRTAPGTEVRLDDARSTRGLSTWLSHDTTSAPPFMLPDHRGWMDTNPASNSCGGDGSNLLELSWRERGFATTTFYAGYRAVERDGTLTIVRYSCMSTGGGPTSMGTVNLTAGLDATAWVAADGGPARAYKYVWAWRDVIDPAVPCPTVESVVFYLRAAGNTTDVEVVTGSRNPTEDFLSTPGCTP